MKNVEYPATVLALALAVYAAVTLLLLVTFVETRLAYVGWWTAGAGALAARAAVELWTLSAPALPAFLTLRNALLLAGAGFFITGSVARDPRARGIILAGFLAFGGLVTAAVALLILGRGEINTARVVAVLAAGAAFLLAAEGYRRGEQVLDDLATRSIFAGLLASGANLILWAGAPRTPGVIAGSEFLGGLWILLLGLGLELQSLQRARRLIVLGRISAVLQRAQGPPELLREVLRLAGELLQVHSGWVFLRDAPDGTYTLAASYHLPQALARNDAEAMRGSCRCLDMLQANQLTQPVHIVNCLRLERIGAPALHASVPLRSSTGIIGLMNLVLPGGRQFSQREMALLATVGGEVGLAIEKARLLDELREKEQVRSTLIKRLLTAQEDERRRIARELHDEMGQSVTALIMNLERTRLKVEEGRGVTAADLERLQRLAEATLEEVRKMIYDLRPTVLDDLGLPAALRWYIRSQIEPRGLAVDLTVRLGDIRLGPLLETAIFRIAQEALWNVVKHAGATRADVELVQDDGRLSLRVRDNGHGFRAGSPPGRAVLRGGVGLGGMQERAALLGGTLRITSTPESGTEVVAEFPLPGPGP